MDWDCSKPWYHGSPLCLSFLRSGTTITQDRDLARVFSHKPQLVEQYVEGNGQRRIKHSGVMPGFLYRVCEEVELGDVYPHPRTTMEPGQEWLTSRELRVELISTTEVAREERMSEQEVEGIRRIAAERDTHR